MRGRAFVLFSCLALLAAQTAQAHHAGHHPQATHAWVRESLPGQDQTSAYLTLDNDDHEGDWLVGVTCACAKTIEIHRMVQAGEQMRMEPVERLPIPARGRVVLAPGGFHLMMFGLTQSLRAGERVRLRLRFALSGEIVVEALVKAGEGAKHVGR